MAVEKKDFQYCGFMGRELADSCYNDYATIYLDADACKMIESETDKKRCITDINLN